MEVSGIFVFYVHLGTDCDAFDVDFWVDGVASDQLICLLSEVSEMTTVVELLVCASQLLLARFDICKGDNNFTLFRLRNNGTINCLAKNGDSDLSMRLIKMNFLVSPTRCRCHLEWRHNKHILVASPDLDINHDLLASHHFNRSNRQVDIVLGFVLHHVL